MKIFISHSFADEYLANILKEILEKSGKIKHAYMAQRIKEYELSISDKIRKEIANSHYVVAIITKNTRESASVNQELGYSQGHGTPVIAMIEESAKIGVLIHGIDSEIFTKENFEEHCKNVLNYLSIRSKRITNNQKITGIGSKKFLKLRNIIDVSQRDYEYWGQNDNSRYLEPFRQEKNPRGGYSYHEKPFTLFSVCPKRLSDDRIQINSENFLSWIKSPKIIYLKDHEFILPINGNEKFSLESVTFFQKYNNSIDKYFEFHRNGFLELGIGKSLFSLKDVPRHNSLYLNLCWITGFVWIYLKFVKRYYDYIKFDGKFDFILTIRNPSLYLMGFGGKGEDYFTYPEPFTKDWKSEIPSYGRHLSLTIENLETYELTDVIIEKNVKKISDEISNAFGLKKSLCYNSTNNEFNLNYFHSYFI